MHIKSTCVALITVAVVGLAAAPIALAAEATPTSSVIQRVKDPTTGIEVSVSQDKPGSVTVEARDSSVTVRRQLTKDRMQTIVTTSTERVVFTIDAAGLSVTSGRRQLRVSPAHPEAGLEIERLLQTSAALGRADLLLGRVKLSAASPVGHTFNLTRAFLLSVAGRRDEAAGVAQAARAELRTARVIDARFGPDDCWNEYVKEAVSAYDEFVDCQRHSTFDFLNSCTLIYDMRAIGAFSWWVSCVGLSGASRL
jgi:hypothetical protein